MPITLADLKGKPKSLTVDTGDGLTVTVKYLPRAVTPRFEATLAALQGTDAGSSRLTADFFCEIVVDWDLVDAEGEPVPFSRAACDDLATAAAWSIISAILSDAAPKAPSAEISPAG